MSDPADDFMRLQQCLDAVMKGSVYAAHLSGAQARLLQLLKQPGTAELNETAIKKGQFALSLDDLPGLVEGEQANQLQIALNEELRTETLANRSFKLETSATLSIEGKLKPAKVPMNVKGKLAGSSTTCATITLTDVKATSIKNPTNFFDKHFRQPRFVGNHFTNVIYVVTAMYHAKVQVEVSNEWRVGVEGGADTPPLLARHLLGTASYCHDKHTGVHSSDTQLIAIDLKRLEYKIVESPGLWKVSDVDSSTQTSMAAMQSESKAAAGDTRADPQARVSSPAGYSEDHENGRDTDRMDELHVPQQDADHYLWGFLVGGIGAVVYKFFQSARF